jgi:hypothetical protein
MVSTVTIDPSMMAAPNPKEATDATSIKIHLREHIVHTLTEMGGSTNNPPQNTAPRVHKGTTPRSEGVKEPTTPLPRTTSSTSPDMVTIKPQDCNITTSSNPRVEPHMYLASGEDTDQNLIYTPHSRRSMILTRRAKATTDQPYSMEVEQIT